MPSECKAWPLAAARIYLGIVFAVAGAEQLLGAGPWGPATDWPTSLRQYLAAFGATHARFYDGFFRSVLLAQPDLVGVLLPGMHLILGVALILGIATRATLGVAMFLLANYMALTGVTPWSPNPISALAALDLAVYLATPSLWRIGPWPTRRHPGRWLAWR